LCTVWPLFLVTTDGSEKTSLKANTGLSMPSSAVFGVVGKKKTNLRKQGARCVLSLFFCERGKKGMGVTGGKPWVLDALFRCFLSRHQPI